MTTFGRYGSADDLAEKIDYEGSVADFFGHYASPDEFSGTEIEIEVRNFVKAYKALTRKLEDLGALL
jgi:hypothetical protein